jgi:hypothetical protein
MSTQSKVQWYAILLALFFLWPSACAGIRFDSQEKSTPPLAVPGDGKSAGADSSQHLASAQAPPEPKYFIHTVQGAGETFAAMARWYTGRSENWMRLARANPDIDPKRIQIGDTIRIPDEIVTTRRAMPKVAPPAPVAGKKSTPAPRNEAELFGPIETPPTEVELFGPIETPSNAGGSANDRSAPDLETLE